jgi:hypothetical protein
VRGTPSSLLAQLLWSGWLPPKAKVFRFSPQNIPLQLPQQASKKKEVTPRCSARSADSYSTCNVSSSEIISLSATPRPCCARVSAVEGLFPPAGACTYLLKRRLSGRVESLHAVGPPSPEVTRAPVGIGCAPPTAPAAFG